ncbi:MAG: glycosyltransferase, partial [Bacteroidia bacterium]|nr:glycosyltransferase [Bacteroidia bacterium]
PNIMQQADVFILPSLIEPWGVVVHEFAAAGFPIICSDKVGAASAFLISEKNGFLFKADDINELKNVIKKMILMSDDEFSNMRTVSHQLAQNITPKKWADELFSIIKL